EPDGRKRPCCRRRRCGPRSRPADQGARARKHRTGRVRRRDPGSGSRQRPQQRDSVRAVLRDGAAAGRDRRSGDAPADRRVRRPRPLPARLAAGRPAARRRVRQPRRPRARRRGHRLHRPAVVAGVQPRRLGHHRRGRRAPVRHGGSAAPPAPGGRPWL
ncbi:MAG: Lipoprotein signal peptidase, partial [uncultured Solirubrobacteraceae bacterium]